VKTPVFPTTNLKRYRFSTSNEPTWDEHVKAVCNERGWSYDQVTSGKK
jgi:hypothetical protein